MNTINTINFRDTRNAINKIKQNETDPNETENKIQNKQSATLLR